MDFYPSIGGAKGKGYQKDIHYPNKQGDPDSPAFFKLVGNVQIKLKDCYALVIMIYVSCFSKFSQIAF